MHPSELLWKCHHPVAGYPAGVVPVPEPIRGRAFFPGGFGLWGAEPGCPLPEFPIGGVVVLGHDFHSEAGYCASSSLGSESLTQPTWRNLMKLLYAVGLPLERCFFTNLYMGLRARTATTGLFPGATDTAFVAHCTKFFCEQVRVQRPALILTLGVQVPVVLGTLSPELAQWAEKRRLRLKRLDESGSVCTGVTFPGLENYRTNVVALIHPSLRHASLRHRRYRGMEGEQTEVLMLRDGMTAAGLATPDEL